MRKYFFQVGVTFLCFISFSCSSILKTNNELLDVNKLPELNDFFENNSQSENFLLTSSGQFSKAYVVICNNIKYSIAVNDSNKIIYISTSDSNFVTLDNIRIGSTQKDFSSFDSSLVYKENGWAYFVKLQSGWNAAFTEGESMTNEPLTRDSKVSFFFKK
ncbi:MAG: hypothetical protein IH619_03345 [Ignavibacterium sp.]|nr:hypothetical protein [Ignavibacterium sp.]